MTRGRLAAVTAASGVALAGLAVVQGAVSAASGAFVLLLAPVAGLLIAVAVYRALHRLCTTGSRDARPLALAGVLSLGLLAIVGVSFGGFPLLAPAAVLALAAALTPRPARI